MKLEYQVSFDDFIAFYDQYRKTDGRVELLKQRLISSITTAFVLFLFVARDHVVIAAIFGSISGIIVFFATPSVQKNSFLKRYAKLSEIDLKNDLPEDVMMEINDNEVMIIMEKRSHSIKWTAIRDFVVTTSHIFLIVKAFEAVIIPISKVKGIISIDHFIDFAGKIVGKEKLKT